MLWSWRNDRYKVHIRMVDECLFVSESMRDVELRCGLVSSLLLPAGNCHDFKFFQGL